MPYNPSSAYPRHSTYTPPVEGRGFARGFNELDWGQKFGLPIQAPGVDVNHAIRRGTQRPDTDATVGAMTAMGRVGMATMAMNSLNSEIQGLGRSIYNRKVWNRAEKGDDITEVLGSKSSEPEKPGLIIPTSSGSRSAPRIREATFPAQGTGGRAHVAAINERLGDIEARQTRTMAVTDSANKVLSSKVGGPMSTVKYAFGAARSRARGGR